MLQKDLSGFYKSEIFANYEKVIHGYSTRFFGSMKMPRQSLTDFSQEAEMVSKNRLHFATALGIDVGQFVYLDQVHGEKISLAWSHDAGRYIQDTDGLLTSEKNLFIFGTFADCLPILFFDPKREVVGLCHAGWKGTVQKIAPKMVEKFRLLFQSAQEDLMIHFGPSIGPCCYEIKEDVAKEFARIFGNDVNVIRRKSKRIFLDIRWANYALLIQAGCNRKNIEIADACTFCQNDIFYSYRREGQMLKGETAAVIGMRL